MRRLSLLVILVALSLASVGLLAFGVERETAPPVVGDYRDPTGAESGAEGLDGETPGLPAATGMRFGIDAGSVDRFSEQAGAPDYATVWVGKWNLDHGWKDTGAALQGLSDKGVTPAIHFYYWGDDMGRTCLWDGCNGKSRAQWDYLAQDLVWHLNADLKGGPALIILESEFNKHGVHQDEGLDELLAAKATYIKTNYPNAKVVLGLGNWYPQAWGTWDRAAAASDYVGIQAMAGSTQDSEDKTLGLAQSTLKGVQTLRDLFGKPVVIQDVAVSSYPEPDHLETQGEAMARFAEDLPALQDAGVEVVIYRSYLDVPDMNLGNHYAEAERHWGLAWHDSGELKPAGQAWMAAILRARGPPPSADMAEVAGR
ncbi:MAG: hypothetical protein QOJ26_1851 [Thermoplasmata archaeon]|nr:hypothetical protein [Thermoplasmata archaeon]